MSQAQQTQTQDRGTLLQVLGKPAYEELVQREKALDQKIKKNEAELVSVITQRVQDKFERRLVEETGKIKDIIHSLEIKMNDKFEKINDKMDSQLKWIIGSMIGIAFTMATLIMGMVYFLHR